MVFFSDHFSSSPGSDLFICVHTTLYHKPHGQNIILPPTASTSVQRPSGPACSSLRVPCNPTHLCYLLSALELDLLCCPVLQKINSEWEIYRWANYIGGREACPSAQASSLEVREPVNACEVLSGENELVIVPFPHVQWVSEGGAVIVAV